MLGSSRVQTVPCFVRKQGDLFEKVSCRVFRVCDPNLRIGEQHDGGVVPKVRLADAATYCTSLLGRVR